MKKAIAVLVALLAMNVARAHVQRVVPGGNLQIGVVVAVDKKSFTIKPEVGKKLTFAYDPDMGKPAIVKKIRAFVGPHDTLGATPDEVKVGMIVEVFYSNQKGVFVCQRAMVIVERLGTREIDFAPMLAKDKRTLPKFVLRLELQSRESLGSFRRQPISIEALRVFEWVVFSPEGS